MTLTVYASLDLPKADLEARSSLPKDCIDLSKLHSKEVADQSEIVRKHQKSPTTIYLGYIDPIYMLSPYHETILRRSIVDCNVVIVVSDPTALSLYWKNGIDNLHIVL